MRQISWFNYYSNFQDTLIWFDAIFKWILEINICAAFFVIYWLRPSLISFIHILRYRKTFEWIKNFFYCQSRIHSQTTKRKFSGWFYQWNKKKIKGIFGLLLKWPWNIFEILLFEANYLSFDITDLNIKHICFVSKPCDRGEKIRALC